jgi:hypothetical protein
MAWHLSRRGLSRDVVVSLFAMAMMPTWPAAAPQNQPDKNSIEVVVRGCLKGRELTADEISGSDELANEVGMLFRLSAKGQVNDEVKRQNGHRVEVTGVVKKTALAEPGLKLGGGRVVIGGSPMSADPTKNPARNPQRRIVPMDVTLVEMIAETCRSAGQR